MFDCLFRFLGLPKVALHHDPFNYKSIAYQSDNLSIHFSPQGGCTDIILAELVQAKEEILVQAYVFTSKDIAHALLVAHDHGARVQVIVDANEANCRGSQIDILKKDINVYTDAYHAIAHNKIIIIDQKTVISGSFNFSASAENVNSENLIVLRNPDVCAVYIANFHAHLAHSVAL